jgi:DNA modification methylase
MKDLRQHSDEHKALASRHCYLATVANASNSTALRETSTEANSNSGVASAFNLFIRGGAAPLRYLVLQGDAFDLIDDLPENSIDLILTSPPYWGLRTYDFEHDWEIGAAWKKDGHSIDDVPPYDWYREHGGSLGLEPTPEWFVAHISEILCKLSRPLKASGNLWLNIGDTYFARWASIRQNGRQGLAGPDRLRRKTPMGGFRQEKNLLLIPARIAIALQESRWILRNDLIWFKPNIPPRPDKDRVRLAHEHFFHFVKRPKEGRAKYFYDKTATEPGDVDVVTYSCRPGESGHSATFPAELIRPRILSSCPLNGIVLDPFCGSGRAVIEAVKADRRAIGFDLSPEFATSSAVAAQQAIIQGTHAQLH